MDREQTIGDVTVAETPRYPSDHTDADKPTGHENSSVRRRRRSAYLMWVLAVVLVVSVVVLHLTGVLGPGEH